jgi:hypothetical protein
MEERIQKALDIAHSAGHDGEHHKMWVVDQMIRALTGCPMVEGSAIDAYGRPYTFEEQGESDEYREWVREQKDGEDGPDTYAWDTGVAP